MLDPVGNLTQWVYNAEGQVTEEINPLGDSRLFGTEKVTATKIDEIGGFG